MAAKLLPAKPCRQAFAAERSFPAGVLGPVLFWALARLAARRASEIGFLVWSDIRSPFWLKTPATWIAGATENV
jgi:hypothetical protein